MTGLSHSTAIHVVMCQLDVAGFGFMTFATYMSENPSCIKLYTIVIVLKLKPS